MTSDGILQDDWEVVERLAERVAFFAAQGCGAELIKAQQEILRFLNELEAKYGELPSILATQSDYIDEAGVRLRLLQRAYALACENNDAPNRTFVSSSLAQIYIEEVYDGDKGKRWLELLRNNLDEHWDEHECNELVRLGNVLQLDRERNR